jgi:hypothetical protein
MPLVDVHAAETDATRPAPPDGAAGIPAPNYAARAVTAQVCGVVHDVFEKA